MLFTWAHWTSFTIVLISGIAPRDPTLSESNTCLDWLNVLEEHCYEYHLKPHCSFARVF